MKKIIKEQNETFINRNENGDVVAVLNITDINDEHGNLLKRFTDSKLCVENKYVYYPNSDIVMINECCEYDPSSGEQILFKHTEYDEKGHIINVITPASSTEYGYDENGNNISIYVEEYDENGDVTTINEVHNTYDSNNNLLETVKKFGENDFLQTTNTYDDNGNLTHSTVKDSYQGNANYSYEYDENGNRIKYEFTESNGNVTIEGYSAYEYDKYNRIIRVLYNDKYESSMRTFEYLCNDDDSIKSVNIKDLTRNKETNDFDIVESFDIDASRYIIDNDHLITSRFERIHKDTQSFQTVKDEYGNTTYKCGKHIEVVSSYVYFDK